MRRILGIIYPRHLFLLPPPAGIQHICPRDLEVHGHTIPANTLMQPLLTEVLKGDHWGDGTSFRPDRFIDEAGRLRRDEHFIPFSIGKRVGSIFRSMYIFSQYSLFREGLF